MFLFRSSSLDAYWRQRTDLSRTLTLHNFFLINKLPRVSYLFLPLSFVHCSDFISHLLISYPPLSLCLSPLLSIFPSVPFVFHSPSPPVLCLALLFPSHPAEPGGLWCGADIYSRGSFISTVSLFKQRAGSQINKMAERMDRSRVLFSLER